MRRKKNLAIRKSSQQQRSQFTVDAIVEATTKLLEKSGVEKTTTNRISDLAGVSVGSFYQYFPNKEALIARIIEKEINTQADKLEKLILTHKDENISQLTKILIEYIADQFYRRHRIAAVLIGQLNQLERVPVQVKARGRLVKLLADLFRERRPELALDDPDIAAYIVVHGVMGVFYMASVDGSLKNNHQKLKSYLQLLVSKFLKA